MPKVYMRVKETHDHYVVAICDKPLLGKTLIDGKIKFKVSEEFYGGALVDSKICINHLERATIANMTKSYSSLHADSFYSKRSFTYQEFFIPSEVAAVSIGSKGCKQLLKATLQLLD